MANDDKQLRLKQEIFCVKYVANGFNATQAAIEAGYSKKTAHVQGPRLLENVVIQNKIEELTQQQIDAASITVQAVLAELRKIAFCDFEEAYNEDGSLKHVKDMPKALRQAIASIEVEELFDGYGKDKTQIGYTKKIKFWPKDKSLDQLGRYLKMFTDKVEHSGKIGIADLVDEAFGSGSKQEREDKDKHS